jgi:creatinine amidohydrolase/Fe(II)-dependent formamide hydrolase-like protein
MKNQRREKKIIRRNFIKEFFFGVSLMSIHNISSAISKSEKVSSLSVKSYEEMRPDEILIAIKKAPVAFIPVSPMIEWHSYHLPMGTDGLICEAICKIMAEKVGGVWFRPLSLGMDSYRNNELKERWGFNQNEDFFGMNFPDLPLKSEYCTSAEMENIIRNRVESLRGIGVKHLFLINHHGGEGQIQLVEDIANSLTDGTTKVHGLKTYQFNDLKEKDGFYNIGGHAGFSETIWLMAFRPELIDLSQLQGGELSVRTTGILHNKPIIENEWNPKNVSSVVAIKLKNRVIDNFLKYVSSEHL